SPGRTAPTSTPTCSTTRASSRPAGAGPRSWCRDPPPERTSPSRGVEARVRGFGRVHLPASLGDSPSSGRAVDGQDCPPAPVLIAQVDEERVPVVLDAQPVIAVARLVKRARCLGHERGPARTRRARRGGSISGGEQ